MRFSSSLSLLACAAISGSGLVSGAPLGRRGVECYYEIWAQSGETCESMAASWGISDAEFALLNPGVSCPNLEVGKAYCVIGEWTPDLPGSSTTTTSSTTVPSTTTSGTTTTTTTPPGSTYTPQMPGIVDNCNRFHKIQSGDGCDVVAQKNGITVAQLRSWNSEINESCSNLWLDYYVCVGVPGTAPPPITTTTTPPGPTYTPQMPGIVENCNKFHKIQSGDGCDVVAQKNGITVAQLRSWNTEINAACSNMWLDYYVCVGVPGSEGTNPNTPALPGAAANCEKWHKIASGDTCDNVAARNTITVNQLRSFNTGINSNCDNLLRDYYACVAVPGMVTPMPGIVTGCTRYYQVVSGDNCEVIASKQSVTVANFRRWNTFINAGCSNLWVDALVCTKAP